MTNSVLVYKDIFESIDFMNYITKYKRNCSQ